MRPGSFGRWPWMLIFFIVKVSCFHNRAAPFPMSNASSLFNSTSASGARDPCVDQNFQSPVYYFTDVALGKKRVKYDDWDRRWFFQTSLSFTLTDVANGNRSLGCVWPTSSWNQWELGCHSLISNGNQSTASETDYFVLLNLEDGTYIREDELLTQGKFGVVEYWFCPIKNGAFPDVYQSKGWVQTNASCPIPPKDGGDHDLECTIPSAGRPLKAVAQWQTPGPLPGTPVLQPRPNPPPPKTGPGLAPPRDCTYSSLAYPEWEWSSRRHNDQNTPSGEVSFNITSRASGAKWNCTSPTKNTPPGIDEREYPSCVATEDPNNPAMINSKLELFFYSGFANGGSSERLSIREDWLCGDPKGTYQTNFTAVGDIEVGSLVSNEPVIIKGSLVKPVSFTPSTASVIPPNINAPGCIPPDGANYLFSWGLLNFIYEAERRYTGFGKENRDVWDPDVQRRLAPYSHRLDVTLINPANNYTISCAINDTALDGSFATQWFSCPPLSAGGRDSVHAYPQYAIQTYINFDRDTKVLGVNQTWYCNNTGIPYQITASGKTAAGPYRFPESNYHSRIVCGNGTNVWRDVVCQYSAFWGVELLCDTFIFKRWCSIDGTRDGSIGWLPGENETFWPKDLFVPQVWASGVERHELPANAFTPYPEPEANSSAANSCTLLSLGGRGPVMWTIRPTKEIQSFTSTFFPPDEGYGNPQWRHTESFPTRLVFDLASSVFPASSYSSSPDKSRGSGVVHNLGTVQWNYYAGANGKWFSGSNLTLTPYMRNWDPTTVFKSVVTLADRFTSERALDIEGGGWDFYNALDWALRFDLSTGYIELNHSWYCDDLNPSNP